MRRKKSISAPAWLTWEGDDFPRNFHSDSIIFYLSEHIYFDSDESYKKSLASTILQEGLSSSSYEAYRMIDSAWITRAGYRFDDDDERFPIYCDNDDPDLYYDATFVEVSYVG